MIWLKKKVTHIFITGQHFSNLAALHLTVKLWWFLLHPILWGHIWCLRWALGSSRTIRLSAGNMSFDQDRRISYLDTELKKKKNITLLHLYMFSMFHSRGSSPSLDAAETLLISGRSAPPDLQTSCSRSHVVLLGQQWKWSLQHVAFIWHKWGKKSL